MTDAAEAERRRVVHDLSNLIMVLQGNLELIRMGLPREGKPWTHLQLACDAAERCRALTELLGALSRESGIEEPLLPAGRPDRT
jgi:hypothetical protein